MGRDMKKEARDFIATQNLELKDFEKQLAREAAGLERKGETQDASAGELITPAF